MQKHLRSWLSPPDPRKNHNIFRKSYYLGTAAWFIQCKSFLDWKASDSEPLLWIHGKRSSKPNSYVFVKSDCFFFPFVAGAGKSILWFVINSTSLFRKPYPVCQFHNHPGYRCFAESWARVIGFLLFRLQGRSKEVPPWIALFSAGPALLSSQCVQ